MGGIAVLAAIFGSEKATLEEDFRGYEFWPHLFVLRKQEKPGANFNSTTIRQWARRPLNGQDVFLVNRAYYDFGGYLEYTIRSAFEAMQEGWNSQLVIDIYDP
ncbi:hypothetical protein pdam_00015637 [Pocillopora damicornis]|uniref:Uncharacterized protein n=1 Tax=Pocillopora damicornis TaxID=46731 RepID=A0A3M6UQL4_POCDA|nr:hypothetical protein pdam_00015637 [Pocillopora damicornis]